MSESPFEKGLYAADLAPGDLLKDSIFATKHVEVKESKGGPYVSLQITDWTGVRDARRFKPTQADLDTLLSSTFIKVHAHVETKPDFAGQVIIDSVAPADVPEEWIHLFTKPLPEEHGDRKARFSALLRSITEPNLFQLLKCIFNEPTWKLFNRAVAASSFHHDYPGGLLEHTLEVATLCDRACGVLPGLRRDLLVTGALLHDIGKLDEMEHGIAAGQYTPNGNLVGHIVSGAMRISVAASGIPKFPQSLLDGLVHLILSHHGQPEFGAAKLPLFAEAHVLSQCDLMSAKVFQCRTMAEKAAPGQFAVRGREGFVFVGEFEMHETITVRTSTASFTTNTRTYHVLGSVAAGSPEQSSSEDDCETREAIPPAQGADFLLRVTGDSMVGAGIMDGDLVFVRKQLEADNGQIVVATIPGEGSVVKRLQCPATTSEDDPGCLLSENPKYPPLPLTEDMRIQGVVTGVIRDV